jgi:oxygen-dependent protoporphyrinogen oxidase
MAAESQTRPKRICVVGAGIAGLAAAHRVVELAREAGTPLDVRLLESRDRPGGSIVTDRHDGLLIEGGPDSFITQKPWGLALCRRIGLESEIIPTNPACRRTFVVRKGRLHPIPEGFLLLAPSRIRPFITSRLFSWPGKLRMGMDLVLPRRHREGDDGDESLASFVRRRFGREALERVAQPLVGGIYTADPETLSLRATMPRFLEMEAKHRSLILAMRRGMKAMRARGSSGGDSGARYSLFVSLRSGMQTLVETLISRLPAVALRTRAEAVRLERAGDSWRVTLRDGSNEPADGVVMACPAFASAGMVRGFDDALAADLDGIEYASSATLSMAFKREQVPHALDGFGFVVPVVEGRTLIAVTFNSVKFEGRAPDDVVLMRAFLGGALQPAVYDMDDDELRSGVLRDLAELIGVRGEPVYDRLYRWPRSMPQYPVGHLQHVRHIDSQLARWGALAVAGNAFGGVGIPDCVHSGEEAARRVVESLTGRTLPPATPASPRSVEVA